MQQRKALLRFPSLKACMARMLTRAKRDCSLNMEVVTDGEMCQVDVRIDGHCIMRMPEVLNVSGAVPVALNYLLVRHARIWYDSALSRFGTVDSALGRFGTGRFGTGRFGTGRFGTGPIRHWAFSALADSA